jgi:tetratricopeptide (TPR) repeat protein
VWPLVQYVKRSELAEQQAKADRAAADEAARAAKAKDEEAKAKAEAEARAKAEADAIARANAEAEARAKSDAEAKAREAEAAARAARDRALEAFRRGVAAQKSGDRAGAIAAYREALAIDAGLAGAWTNLALALDAEGKREEALEAARTATRQPSMSDAPRRAHAMRTLGHVAANAGKRDEAIAAYQQALEADARQGEAATALARLCMESGDTEKAIAALQVAKAAGAGQEIAKRHRRAFRLHRRRCGGDPLQGGRHSFSGRPPVGPAPVGPARQSARPTSRLGLDPARKDSDGRGR